MACVVCQDALCYHVEWFTSECGHLLCGACHSQLMKSPCPVCRRAAPRWHTNYSLAEFARQSDYQMQHVTCKMCTQQMKRSEMPFHKCLLELLTCECGISVYRKDMEKHKSECGESLVHCSLCDAMVKNSHALNHFLHAHGNRPSVKNEVVLPVHAKMASKAGRPVPFKQVIFSRKPSQSEACAASLRWEKPAQSKYWHLVCTITIGQCPVNMPFVVKFRIDNGITVELPSLAFLRDARNEFWFDGAENLMEMVSIDLLDVSPGVSWCYATIVIDNRGVLPLPVNSVMVMCDRFGTSANATRTRREYFAFPAMVLVDKTPTCVLVTKLTDSTGKSTLIANDCSGARISFDEQRLDAAMLLTNFKRVIGDVKTAPSYVC